MAWRGAAGVVSQRLGDVVEEDDVALLLRYKGKAVAAASVIVFGQDHARVRGRAGDSALRVSCEGGRVGRCMA